MTYNKGDMVKSVGGDFISGIVEGVEESNDMELLTIRWLRHRVKGEIDFVQKRSANIVRMI